MKCKPLIPISFPAGTVLGLTEAQAKARAHVVTQVEKRKGWYLAQAAVQFKAGDAFELDGELPKHLADQVVLPDGRTAAEAQRAAEVRRAAKAAAEAEKAAAEAEPATQADADAAADANKTPT